MNEADLRRQARGAFGPSLADYLVKGETALEGWAPERLHQFRLTLDGHLALLASQSTAHTWLKETAKVVAPTGDEMLDDLLTEPLGMLHGLSDELGKRAGRPAWFTASVWGGLGVAEGLAGRLQLKVWQLASALRTNTEFAAWWAEVAPVPECHVVLAACSPLASNDFFEEGTFRKRRLLLVVRQIPADDYVGLKDDGLSRPLALGLVSCIEAAAIKAKARRPHPPVPQDWLTL